jgi:phosphoglycolate phosphatase-like HAD superfamily hydrolase
MEAARKAGLAAIGVTSGTWSAEELRDAGATEVYRNVAELSAKFEQSVLGRKRSEG